MDWLGASSGVFTWARSHGCIQPTEQLNRKIQWPYSYTWPLVLPVDWGSSLLQVASSAGKLPYMVVSGQCSKGTKAEAIRSLKEWCSRTHTSSFLPHFISQSKSWGEPRFREKEQIPILDGRSSKVIYLRNLGVLNHDCIKSLLFKKCLYIYLAAPGLSWGMHEL